MAEDFPNLPNACPLCGGGVTMEGLYWIEGPPRRLHSVERRYFCEAVLWGEIEDSERGWFRYAQKGCTRAIDTILKAETG